MGEETLMKLYRGVFKFTKGARVIYRPGHSERQAWYVMCMAIATEDGLNDSTVLNYFDYEQFRGKRFELEVEKEGVNAKRKRKRRSHYNSKESG